MRKLHIGAYLGSLTALFIAAALGIFAFMQIGKAEHARHFMPYLVLLVYANILLVLVLWNKIWATIQDGNARTTPNKAIGLCFLPIINLLWIFKTTVGFAQDYNAFIKRHSLTAAKVPVALVAVYAVLTMVQYYGSLYFIIKFMWWYLASPEIAIDFTNVVVDQQKMSILLGLFALSFVTSMLVVFSVARAANTAIANTGHRAVEIIKMDTIRFTWSWVAIPGVKSNCCSLLAPFVGFTEDPSAV